MFIHVREQSQLLYSFEVAGTVELGRQRVDEPPPYARVSLDGAKRLIIADLQSTGVSRRHARITPLTASHVRIENVSTQAPLVIQGVQSLAPGAQIQAELPLWLSLGDRHVQIESSATISTPLASLAQPTQAPRPQHQRAPQADATLISPAWQVADDALPWLRAVLNVLQSAATSDEFLQLAPQAVVDLAHFDSALVLERADEDWCTLASATRDDETPATSFSRHVAHSVHQQKRTLWQDRPQLKDASRSLAHVAAVIASPILDCAGNVIAILYADRSIRSSQAVPTSIAPTDAALVELLAGSVANGIARLEQQQQAIAARVQFEQFFTPQLARHLQQDPALLDGREAEISILFADIRRFSTASERLGPAKTFHWIRDVMDALSECVMRHAGVLVDYVGDEIIAMWGAPEPQPNHAHLACMAALDMQTALQDVSQQWNDALGGPTELGIGICTGPAHVGNIGSMRKFKYGPLGNTVNLASRVQGLTRHVDVSLLVTASTHAQLTTSFATRRISKVRVAHIDTPVDLFEVATATDLPASIASDYALALNEYEAARFGEAARHLQRILDQHPLDGPAQLLFGRAQHALQHPPSNFDPVWEPGSK